MTIVDVRWKMPSGDTLQLRVSGEAARHVSRALIEYAARHGLDEPTFFQTTEEAITADEIMREPLGCHQND